MKCSGSNPFSTRCVRPGALPWQAPASVTIEILAAKFREQCRNRGSIVGPHGSGKSTLLTHLVPQLGAVNWYQTPETHRTSPSGIVTWHVVRRGKRPFHQVLLSRKVWLAGGILCVDGWEQLRGWETVCLRCLLRKTGMGLLVTCHAPRLTLPVLWNTTLDARSVQSLVVDSLLPRSVLPQEVCKQLSDLRLIERLLMEEQGSVREVFMRLYDLVENCGCSPEMLSLRTGSATRMNQNQT